MKNRLVKSDIKKLFCFEMDNFKAKVSVLSALLFPHGNWQNHKELFSKKFHPNSVLIPFLT